MKTEAAQAANLIRKELKQKFVSTKFTVNSYNYTGGDSVRIHWVDGPTSSEVRNVVAKYEYGKFDGMRDIYEIINDRDDIPQAKYIQLTREMSEEIGRKLVKELKNKMYHCENVSYENMHEYIPELCAHVNTLVYRDFDRMSLT